MPPSVHVVTTVGGTAVGILPQALEHYRALGVRSFFVTIHLQAPDKAYVARVREMAASCGVGIDSVVIDPDPNRAQTVAKERIMRRRPDDWFLPIDADEFHEYPAGLMTTLADCDRLGYDYVWGLLIDRLSRDGALTPLEPHGSVWQQYPLGGFVTYPLLGGDPRKIAAVKGRVVLGVGHHVAMDGVECPIDRHVVPVHHFKWVGTLIPYLEKRLRDYKRLGKPWWTESERCLKYLERYGRIDVTDPRFHAASCDPHYPAWDRAVDVLRTINGRWGHDQTPRDEVIPIDVGVEATASSTARVSR